MIKFRSPLLSGSAVSYTTQPSLPRGSPSPSRLQSTGNVFADIAVDQEQLKHFDVRHKGYSNEKGENTEDKTSRQAFLYKIMMRA